MTQRSGRAAQNRFTLLCSQHDITCNSANEDDFGWDYILDIPPATTHAIAADRTPLIRQALVQIKSTTSIDRRARLKLSNALNLSKLQLPCFVILFHQSTNDGGHRIFARHFWRELIEQALRRARLASVEGMEPHKKIMTIGFSNQDEHSDDLIPWIVSSVLDLPVNYGTDKATLYNTLGYGTSGFRGKATIKLTKGLKDIVDHQVRLKDSLPVSYIKLTDARFGIDAPIPIVEETRGSIKIQPNPIEGFSFLLRSDDGEIIAMPSTLTAPTFPGLKMEDYKFLLKTWMFDAVVSQREKISITLNIRMDTRVPLPQIVEVAKFLSWQGKTIDLKLVRKDSLLWAAKFSFPASSYSGDFCHVSRYANTLDQVLIQAGHDPCAFSVLDLNASKESLLVFDAVLCDGDVQVGMELCEPIDDADTLTSAIGYISTTVADVHFYVIFSVTVIALSDDDYHVRLNFGTRTWLDCFVSDDLRVATENCLQNYAHRVRVSGEECVALDNVRLPEPSP